MSVTPSVQTVRLVDDVCVGWCILAAVFYLLAIAYLRWKTGYNLLKDLYRPMPRGLACLRRIYEPFARFPTLNFLSKLLAWSGLCAGLLHYILGTIQ